MLHSSRAATRPKVPVLILGKGITALGVLRAVARRGRSLYVAGASGDLITQSRWYRPLPGNPPSGDLASLLASQNFERMVLLPTSDKWALVVSRLEPGLASRFPSFVAPPHVLEKFVDKSQFAELVETLGVPHPRTRVLKERNALAELPAECLTGSFLKPTQSGPFAQVYGGKALRFGNREEALHLFDDATGRGFELMLQEFIPGPPTRHFFVEGYKDRQGRICGLFARRRLRMYPPDFGNSSSTESIPLTEVAPAADSLRRLLDGIGYRGVFSAEFKLDERDGLFKVLEVNARPWWYVGFAAACGVDVCDMAYRDALGEEVPVVSSYRVGQRCLSPRLDLAGALAARKENGAGLGTVLRSWLGAQQLTLAWDDPSPGIGELLTWSRSRLRRKLAW